MSQAKYKCDICEYSTSQKHHVKRHKSTHRPDSKKVTSNCILCVMCNHTCASRNFMLEHYKSKHDIVISDKECLTFENKGKFYEWKACVENSEKNHFRHYRGQYTSVDGKAKFTFVCFRDGVFKTKGSKVRHEKILGSNKINGFCPARMDVLSLPCGEVKVEFLKTHVGHQSELGRMRLSKSERDEVAKSIAMHIPCDNILDNLRATISMDQVERRDLITRRDIRNIARDYNLKAEGVRHNNDSTSVHSGVQEMQETEAGRLALNLTQSEKTLSPKTATAISICPRNLAPSAKKKVITIRGPLLMPANKAANILKRPFTSGDRVISAPYIVVVKAAPRTFTVTSPIKESPSTTTPVATTGATASELAQQLEAARREVQAYKELLSRKEREAEQYRLQLQSIASRK